MKKLLLSLLMVLAFATTSFAVPLNINIKWEFNPALESLITGFEIYYTTVEDEPEMIPALIDSASLPSDREVTLILDISSPQSKFRVAAVYIDGTRVFSDSVLFTYYQAPTIKSINAI